MPKTEKQLVGTSIDSDFPMIVNVINVAEFIQFAQWFATPKIKREQKTQKAFADTIGVCEDTLTDWKRHPQFWPLVQTLIGEQMKESIPDVIHSLHSNAVSKGGASEVNLYLKIAGLIHPTKK